MSNQFSLQDFLPYAHISTNELGRKNLSSSNYFPFNPPRDTDLRRAPVRLQPSQPTPQPLPAFLVTFPLSRK